MGPAPGAARFSFLSQRGTPRIQPLDRSARGQPGLPSLGHYRHRAVRRMRRAVYAWPPR